MSVVGQRFDSLTSIPVVIEGNGDWSDADCARINWSFWQSWRGRATCAEPFVGMIFVQTAAGFYWCRTNGGNGDCAVELRVALTTTSDGRPELVGTLSMGGGIREWQAPVPLSFCVPALPDRREYRTGVISEFVSFASAPAVSASMLFVARRDVRFRRNYIWHVRDELASSIPEPFRCILTYGRTGRRRSTDGGL